MSLIDFDLLNGDHMMMDSDTGSIYDEHHQLMGSYNDQTGTFHSEHGEVTGFYDKNTSQLFDEHHSLEGTFKATGTHSTSFFDSNGNIETTLNHQTGDFYNSVFEQIGQFKKIW